MQNNKVRYSRFIRDLNITDAENDFLVGQSIKDETGEIFLTQDVINVFLNRYIHERNITTHKFGYHLPDYIASANAGWLLALKNTYELPAANPASVSPAQGELLKAILANISAKTVVEIGSYLGISTLWLAAGMASSNAGGKLFAIDTFVPKFPWPPFHYACVVDPKSLVAKTIDSAGFADFVHFIESDSKTAAMNFNSWLGQDEIDLLFIDGDHTIEGCKADFELFAARVAVGGYIILHDIFPEFCGHEGPRFVIDHLLNNNRHQYQVIEMVTAPHNFGIAIIRKLQQ